MMELDEVFTLMLAVDVYSCRSDHCRRTDRNQDRCHSSYHNGSELVANVCPMALFQAQPKWKFGYQLRITFFFHLRLLVTRSQRDHFFISIYVCEICFYLGQQ